MLLELEINFFFNLIHMYVVHLNEMYTRAMSMHKQSLNHIYLKGGRPRCYACCAGCILPYQLHWSDQGLRTAISWKKGSQVVKFTHIVGRSVNNQWTTSPEKQAKMLDLRQGLVYFCGPGYWSHKEHIVQESLAPSSLRMWLFMHAHWSYPTKMLKWWWCHYFSPLC